MDQLDLLRVLQRNINITWETINVCVVVVRMKTEETS